MCTHYIYAMIHIIYIYIHICVHYEFLYRCIYVCVHLEPGQPCCMQGGRAEPSNSSKIIVCIVFLCLFLGGIADGSCQSHEHWGWGSVSPPCQA